MSWLNCDNLSFSLQGSDTKYCLCKLNKQIIPSVLKLAVKKQNFVIVTF